MKHVGIWWTLHIGKMTWGSGPRHGATTENTRRYIGFAAKNGFGRVLSEGWNLGWDGGWIANAECSFFAESHPDYDLEGLAAYARERRVKLIGHNETSSGRRRGKRQESTAGRRLSGSGARSRQAPSGPRCGANGAGVLAQAGLHHLERVKRCGEGATASLRFRHPHELWHALDHASAQGKHARIEGIGDRSDADAQGFACLAHQSRRQGIAVASRLGYHLGRRFPIAPSARSTPIISAASPVIVTNTAWSTPLRRVLGI